MITTLATYQDPLRAELAEQFEASETDFAISCRSADAGRTPPYWPFSPLTDAQRRAQAAQEQAMRDGKLARWGAGS